jgi:protease-4
MRLFIALLIDALLVMFWPLRWWRRRTACPRGGWLELEIEGEVADVVRRPALWDRRRRPTSIEVLRRLADEAALDVRVAGVLVKLSQLSSGSATATGLRDVLLDLRRRGKRVVVYLPRGAGTRETYVASAADQIYVAPEAEMAPLGFVLRAHHIKRALDQVGVQPDVFARGRFKTAGEFMTQTHMSGEQREQLEAYLDVAWETLIEGLVSGRSVSRTLAEQWVNDGPWTARTAVVQGLADGCCYPGDLATKLAPPARGEVPLVPAAKYLRRRVVRWRWLWRRPAIAVVQMHGTIAPGKSSGRPLPLVLDQDICELFRTVAEDRKLRGVILHVNSPGGSALASHHMLHELRRLSAKKPVVAYLADVAASGGYLVACGAHSIVARPTTLTGSIGVIAARFVVEPLLERLGITTEVVQRGARANLHSAAHRLDDGERAVLGRHLEEAYQAFLQVVATGRGRDLGEIEPLAGGRVYAGRHAHEQGLVDRLGGFDLALDEVRSRIGKGAELLRPVIVSPRRRALGPSALRNPFGLAAAAFTTPGNLPTLAQNLTPRHLAGPATLALGAPRERVWLWCPYEAGEG